MNSLCKKDAGEYETCSVRNAHTIDVSVIALFVRNNLWLFVNANLRQSIKHRT
ncbi:MAG: hypothetical protein NVSMB38_39370 [Ktedonobacteraceae bacterium]